MPPSGERLEADIGAIAVPGNKYDVHVVPLQPRESERSRRDLEAGKLLAVPAAAFYFAGAKAAVPARLETIRSR